MTCASTCRGDYYVIKGAAVVSREQLQFTACASTRDLLRVGIMKILLFFVELDINLKKKHTSNCRSNYYVIKCAAIVSERPIAVYCELEFELEKHPSSTLCPPCLSLGRSLSIRTSFPELCIITCRGSSWRRSFFSSCMIFSSAPERQKGTSCDLGALSFLSIRETAIATFASLSLSIGCFRELQQRDGWRDLANGGSGGALHCNMPGGKQKIEPTTF